MNHNQVSLSHMPYSILGILVALLVALFSPVSAVAQSGGLGIAAIVNDDVISVFDLETRVSLTLKSSNMANTPEARNRLRLQTLQRLIDEKLMLQESQRAGITISQQDIDRELERIAQSNNSTVTALKSSFQSMQIPLTVLMARLEAELGWRRLILSQVAPTIAISEDEISEEFDRIKASAGQPEYLLAEILLPVSSSSQDTDMRSLIARLYQDIKNGTPFNAIAQNFSRAPTASAGGDMGWTKIAHLGEERRRALQYMTPGQVSAPIRSLNGYSLLMLRDLRKSPAVGGGEVYLKLSQFHVATPEGSDLTAINQTLTRATQAATTCAQLEATQGGLKPSTLSGSMGEVKLSALPANMQSLLGVLAVGKPSRPITTGGGLAIMMVCERSTDTVDMETIRSNIAIAIKSQRIDIAAVRHMRNLKRTAFVDVRL